jgi:predicted nucleic acid-binding protein
VDGPCAKLLDGVYAGRIKMAYDARILAEYRDVLCRPRLRLNPNNVIQFLEFLRGQMLITPESKAIKGPDPDDLMFVEAALAVADRTIVTGNLSHFPDGTLNGVRVITPAQALAEMIA